MFALVNLNCAWTGMVVLRLADFASTRRCVVFGVCNQKFMKYSFFIFVI